MQENQNVTGYFRHPDIFEETVVFVSEDDLWEVPRAGGTSRRVTSGRGAASFPFYSPDGTRIAYTSTEEGATEIFVIDAKGSSPRQLTFLGARSATVGWTPDGKVLFRSDHRQPFQHRPVLFVVDPEGAEPRPYGVGPAHCLSHQSNGPGMVLARNATDLAYWKRYRGGTAAVVWRTRDGEHWERLFEKFTAGFTRPMWIDERLWVVSDHEGHGNLYVSTLDGTGLTRVTSHTDYYVRHPATDGQTIVYACGAKLWTLDSRSDALCKPIEIEHRTPRTQVQRIFVNAEDYIMSYALHPEGHSMAVTARGKLFNFGFWEGGVRQNGTEHGVRYDDPVYLDGERMLVVSDESGESAFEVHSTDPTVSPKVLDFDEFRPGRPLEVEVAPGGDAFAFSNHRNELVWVELETLEATIVESSAYRPIEGFDWSPCGRFLAYAIVESSRTSRVRIFDVEEDLSHDVTSGNFWDTEPVFDPDGRYLYFLSGRFFEPVYDQLFFEISFPKTMKPCVVTLREELDSPFFQKPRPLDSNSSDDNSSEDDADQEQEGISEGSEDPAAAGSQDESSEDAETTQIEFEWIWERVEAFPVKAGHYSDLAATSERVFWASFPLVSARHWNEDEAPSGAVKYVDLSEYEVKTFARGIQTFGMGPDRKTVALWGDELRVASASSSNVDDDDYEVASRKNGVVDLERIRVEVDRRAEWRQMLREAWRLMRDHFWTPDLGGVDWDDVWDRYSPLLDRLAARSEFSDLVWTMQGEMGTSHAYEYGGDYRIPPQYRPGFLGADLEWVEDAYRVEHIVRGDSWLRKARSPLARPGADVRRGDRIVAINGRVLDRQTSIQQRLVAQAGREVELVIERAEQRHTVTVRALRDETPCRYREWVETRRERVHEATDGRVGYVHIPDMGPEGFAEFHRGFLTEARRDALIVDVRDNGGGHVSQLILEKLARKRLGYSITRWGTPESYPSDSLLGPVVALADEHSGSDGDIFCHAFKMLELGPVIGKRTWGGVVGIWPRYTLVDFSVTTQPEFAFWMHGVGFEIENTGTEPDIEVEVSPGEYRIDEDPQLDRALAEIEDLLVAEDPRLPNFGPGPGLKAPALGSEEGT